MPKRDYLIPPAGVPVQLSWVLPASFNEETAGQFTQEARKLLKLRRPSWSTVIRDHNQKDYLCIDIGEASFPGFLMGDVLDNGQPAENKYVVTLSRRAAGMCAKLFRLLNLYGAEEISWEVLEQTPSPSPLQSSSTAC